MLIILVISNGVHTKKTLFFLLLLADNFLFVLFFAVENMAYNINIATIFAKLTFSMLCFFPVLLILLTFQVIEQRQFKFIYSGFSYLLFLPSLFFITMVLAKRYTLNINPINSGYYIKVLVFSPFFVLFNFIYEITSLVLLLYCIRKGTTNILKKKELSFLFIGLSIPVIYMVSRAVLEQAGVKNSYPFETWFVLFTNIFLYLGISRYGIMLENIFKKKVLNSNLLLIGAVNLSGEIFEANDSLLRFLKLKRREVLGKYLYDLFEKSGVYFAGFEDILKYIDSLNKDKKVTNTETRSIFAVLNKKEKNNLYFEVIVNPILIKNLLFGHIFILNDITSRKTAENLSLRKHKLLEAVVKSIDELLSNSDLDQAILNALEKIGSEMQVDRVYIFENHKDTATEKIFTSQRFEWTNSTTSPQINNPELTNIEFESFFPEMFEALSNNREFSGFIKDFSDNLKEHFIKQDIVSLLIVPIFVDHNFWGFIGLDECEEKRMWANDEIMTLKAAAEVIGDAITHRRMADMIKQLAYYDIVTGLPNRALFYDRLKLSLEFSKRNKKLLALILMDFDKFKIINDTYGHDVGDELLKVFAGRILGIIRKSDTISRLGGDEFVFILTDLKEEEDIIKIAEKILDCFNEPFMVKGFPLKIKGSLGISVYPADGIEVVDLIRNADIAMYKAKKHGGSKYKFYSNIAEA